MKARVDEELAAFLHRRLDLIAGPVGSREAAALLSDFVLSGGKRIRPLFCYWGWRGAGGPDSTQIVRAAASLELFHAFALIHDDIMDASTTRRGRPALHRSLAALHADHGWQGDPERFGTNVAILWGDLCMAWSEELFRHCGFPAHRMQAAEALLHRMRTEVIVGQYLDLREQVEGGSLAGALKVIRYKAANYTVQYPLEIGAVLAGADRTLRGALGAFGVAIGEAFQLRDDLLGVFGDSAMTGKSAVDDLREGKPTVLMAIARHRAAPNQAERIRALHGNQDLDEDGAATLRGILIDTGARAAVEEMIAERTFMAMKALEEASVTEAARAALQSLAIAATRRQA